MLNYYRILFFFQPSSTNTPASFKNSQVTAVNSFMTLWYIFEGGNGASNAQNGRVGFEGNL